MICAGSIRAAKFAGADLIGPMKKCELKPTAIPGTQDGDHRFQGLKMFPTAKASLLDCIGAVHADQECSTEFERTDGGSVGELGTCVCVKKGSSCTEESGESTSTSRWRITSQPGIRTARARAVVAIVRL